MSTTTEYTQRTLARDDVAGLPERSPATARASRPGGGRGWALTGAAAALAYLGGSIAGGVADPVYDATRSGDPRAVMAALAEGRVALAVFHALTTVAALLLLVFGAGLARRLRPALPEGSLLPGVAGAGVLVTAAVQVLGSGLDTELIEGVTRPDTFVAETAVLYGHWIGTIPYVWVTAGASALALAWAALRHGAAPRWIGAVSLVLGAGTVLGGASPLQYVAGMTAPLWVLVVGIGLAVGDRAFRGGNRRRAA